MSSSRFSDLTKELQQEVMRQCEINDLLNLARTSKVMHILALPVLYHCVDISCHSQAGRFHSVHHDRMVEGNSPERELGGLADVLQNRQKLFIDTLTRHPEYGIYVVSLTWTYQSYEDELCNVQSPTWKAFQYLIRVKTLDVCSFNWEEALVIPPALFPSATSVRLSGRMPYAFLLGMISATPSKLVSLELDNIQGFGQLQDGEHLPHTDDLSEIPESDDSNGYPRVKHPGPIRGYLRQIQGLCTSLRHLCLRSVGQDDYRDYRWSAQKDQERYQEWASFIDSVKPTLETLVVEQGIEPKGLSRPICGQARIGRKHQIGRPMDAKFMEHVMPVLLRGPWPKLKKMKIRGVGGKPRYDVEWSYTAKDTAVFTAAKEQLQIALGTGALITWDAEASKSFYQYSRGGYFSFDSDLPSEF